MSVSKIVAAGLLAAVAGVQADTRLEYGPYKLTDGQTVIHCVATTGPTRSGRCIGSMNDLSLEQWAQAAGFKSVDRYFLVITDTRVLYVMVVSK